VTTAVVYVTDVMTRLQLGAICLRCEISHVNHVTIRSCFEDADRVNYIRLCEYKG
jgi:hypothetical protein